ncbi:MAG TPA: ABC transporter permease [Nitrososphaerales archaeon]|nr:ABC transporter permease [Nitrososphaerales archaeon]
MIALRDFLPYLGRRVLGAIAVLLGAMLLVFFISYILNPDPAHLWAGARASKSSIAAVVARYHLNQPWYVQLYYFIQSYATGNLGIDPQTGKSILSEMEFYFPNTLELVLVSMVMIAVLGVASGYFAGMHFGTKIDHAIRIFYLATWSSPYYLGGFLAILVFSTYLPLFPSGGMYSLTLANQPAHITGIYILDALIQLNGPAFLSGLQHVFMPAAVLALLDFGLVARIMRSSILNSRWSTHVKAARAKGMAEGEVRRNHILRNALIDTNTIIAVTFGFLLSGTIVIEEIFAWPGIGYFTYQAIVSIDYPVLVPCVLLFTLGVIVANFIADVFYSLLDPRIALGEGGGAEG